MRLIRVMCTGRIDLAFVLRAFSKGADGVFIAGCHLDECNYITHGNYYALSMAYLFKKLLEHMGVYPARLRMELISGGEGNRFAEIVNDFAGEVQRLGPLGTGEGLSESELKENLAEITRLIPHIKMAKREKLEMRFSDKEEYSKLYTSDEIDQLLHDVEAYYIDPEKCQACMTCAKRCPVEAIDGGKNRIHVIDQEKCIKCGLCLEACPPRFGAVVKISGESVPGPIAEDKRTIDRKRKRKQADSRSVA